MIVPKLSVGPLVDLHFGVSQTLTIDFGDDENGHWRQIATDPRFEPLMRDLIDRLALLEAAMAVVVKEVDERISYHDLTDDLLAAIAPFRGEAAEPGRPAPRSLSNEDAERLIEALVVKHQNAFEPLPWDTPDDLVRSVVGTTVADVLLIVEGALAIEDFEP